ncbi:MAG: amidohydrolase family protein [Candidatus Muirbacterium halophilum]|nr:amidohydrolase family protein [Candidatus Muirbacterium halophilum]MCK9477449.1 amidohydrolase family protein [Candidatus Muirbacterium halophilum]
MINNKLFFNGNIYSDEFSKIYYAVLVDNKGIIIDLFKEKNDIPLEFFKNSVDLEGNTVYPGFHDCHVHLEFLTKRFSEIIFNEKTDKYEFLDTLKKSLNNFKKNEWIIGGGFSRNFLENMPDLFEIDRITPYNPIFFHSKDIHSFLINSKAMEFIPDDKKQLFDKYSQKNKNGLFTGLIFEKGEDIFEEYLKTNIKDLKDNFKLTQNYFHKYGITTVHNMDDDVIADFIKDEKDNLKLNILNYYRNHINKNNDMFFGLKLFADGSLGSLTCCMKDNFTNYDFSGILVLNEDEIDSILKQCSKNNIDVAIHAIGDKAVSIILDKFIKYNMKNSRIEHAQLISDEDIVKIKSKWFSMQPLHIKDDIELSKKYLSDRINYLYRFRTILNNSGNLIFGSDVPVVEADVVKSVFWATSRDDNNKDWNINETISVKEALIAYTITPAVFEKSFSGDLLIGNQADMVVLSQDMLKCDNILNTKVLMTVYKGEIVFRYGE